MTQGVLIEVRPSAPPIVDNDERYSTPGFMAWVRSTVAAELGLESVTFDLDPFACAEASQAPRYYDVSQNGLALPWLDSNYANGPWSLCAEVTEKVRHEVETARARFVAHVLPDGRREQDWWQDMIEPIRDRRDRSGLVVTTHSPRGRVRYGSPGDPLGLKAGSPNFTSVLLVWRRG